MEKPISNVSGHQVPSAGHPADMTTPPPAAAMTHPARRPDPDLALALARIAALEQRMEQIEQSPPPRRRRDPADGARLLSVVARLLGGSVFSVADLLRLAPHDSELRAVLDGADGRRLGAMLKRLRTVRGLPYELRRCGRDEQGALWAVSALRHTAR
jgi:hypothetical protein